MDNPEQKNKLQKQIGKIGICLAVIFYLIAVVHVLNMGVGNGKILDKNTVYMTFAHWNTESGAREGIDKALRKFEKIKAKQGVKVNVQQTTIPFSGYQQWQMGQLLSGEPADLLAFLGNSALKYQYVHPLGTYLSKPNPFNKGTVLEGIAWKDTYLDNMDGAFSSMYADYFGIGMSFHLERLHVNLDLLEKATGSRKLPQDLTDWLEMCAKVKAYAEKKKEPISAIAVGGLHKSQLDSLLRYYYSQTNGELPPRIGRYCDGTVESSDIFKAIENNKINTERLLAVVDILRELGQYFIKGFTSVDFQQAEYLFFSGKAAFLPVPTWASFSIVKNSPFKVAIIPIPPLGYKHKYSKYYTGRVTEAVSNIGGTFCIPKDVKHFRLSLELLQFLTSYDIDQMVMNERKWPPAVKKAKYEGLMKSFKPNMKGNLPMLFPFAWGWRTNSELRAFSIIEDIIQDNPPDGQAVFLKRFKQNKQPMENDVNEFLISCQRSFLDLEMQRSCCAVGLMNKDVSDKTGRHLNLKREVVLESFVKKTQLRLNCKSLADELKELK